MNHRSHSSRRPFAVPIALSGFLLVACAAHAQPTAGEPMPPRTSDGRPDLQGVWNFSTITPMKRPGELAGQEVLTNEEAAALEARRAQSRNYDQRDPDPAVDLVGAYNNFWHDWGNGSRLHPTHISGRGSAGRKNSPVDPGRGAATGGPQRATGRPRRSGGLALHRALLPGVQLRTADRPECVQQQHAAVPNPGLCRDSHRDGS